MKKILAILSVLILCVTLCACNKETIQEESIRIQEGNSITNDDTDILLTMNQKSNALNQIWIGTMQLVWNDLLDTLNNGKPVTLLPQMPKCAIEMNKRPFSKEYISENSYYIKHGILDQALFNLIKKEIKEKFNEESDILDAIGPTNTLVFYSMLKKDFQFEYVFDKLHEEPFGSNPENVKYFGINEKSDKGIRDNVQVISYKNENNYIIKLLTKSDDEVILYRTDENKTLDKYWEDIQNPTGNGEIYKPRPLEDNDKVKIPYLDFFYKKVFDELSNKTIKDTGYEIDQAIETVDLKMDETGVKLKSEAIIVMKNSMRIEEEIHNYYFNKPFTMFLVEKGKTVPYFGARINDVDKINIRE